MEVPTEERVGARLLGEIEETSLDEVLSALRRAVQATATAPAPAAAPVPGPANKRPKVYLIPELDALVAQNFRNTQSTPLQLTGRYMPLVYKLVSALVTKPHRKAVVVIDIENRFDATRLTGSREDAEDDIRHVHVYRPARCSPEKIREVVAGAETWMLYGNHESRAREWWGTIVIGSPYTGLPLPPSASSSVGGRAAPVDVTASWRGWLQVDREELPGFPVGVSAREILKDRDKRQDVVDAALWRATCQWGGFSFAEPNGGTSTPRCAADGVDEDQGVADGRNL